MVSEGLSEVLRDAIEDVGVCLDRIRDLVDRNFRRSLCGRMTGIEGHDSGILEMEKKRCVDSSPEKEKYLVGMASVCGGLSEGQGGSSLRPAARPMILSHKPLPVRWGRAEKSSGVQAFGR